jgi:hypothetical protein
MMDGEKRGGGGEEREKKIFPIQEIYPYNIYYIISI